MEVGVNLAKINIIQMQNLSFDFVTSVTLNYDTDTAGNSHARTHAHTHITTTLHHLLNCLF